jgi:hypothetical protein
MQSRIMYVEYKGGGLTGPARIGRVRFSKTGGTLYYAGRAFRSLKGRGTKANYYDVATNEPFWISGPRRDGGDRLYGESTPVVIDDDVREEYWASVRGRPAPPAARPGARPPGDEVFDAPAAGAATDSDAGRPSLPRLPEAEPFRAWAKALREHAAWPDFVRARLGAVASSVARRSAPDGDVAWTTPHDLASAAGSLLRRIERGDALGRAAVEAFRPAAGAEAALATYLRGIIAAVDGVTDDDVDASVGPLTPVALAYPDDPADRRAPLAFRVRDRAPA